jgi:hypothetical protein
MRNRASATIRGGEGGGDLDEDEVIFSRSIQLALALAMLGHAAPDPTGGSLAGPPVPVDRGPAQEPRLRLELNIPAYRLDVLVSGRLVWSYAVAVGMPRYPTPVREYAIGEVVWNPWWYPPPSDWARDERPMPPGPENPMGRVKLQASQYIYLHGTPAEASLGQAASHGCIRMSSKDAMELARLVHLFASPGISSTELDALEANPGRTRSIRLDAPVPFRSVYRIVEVGRGMLEMHPDVYGRVADRAGEAERVLAEAGVDMRRVDRARFEELLRASRREHMVVPLDSLLVSLSDDTSSTAMILAGIGPESETPQPFGETRSARRSSLVDGC